MGLLEGCFISTFLNILIPRATIYFYILVFSNIYDFHSHISNDIAVFYSDIFQQLGHFISTFFKFLKALR